MSTSPSPAPRRDAPLDQAILAMRRIDREESPRTWERLAEQVAKEFDASVWRPYRLSMGRGAVEPADLRQAALSACFEALSDWNPSKGSASAYLTYVVKKAVSREIRMHSYPVSLPESRKDRRVAYETRASNGCVRADESRSQELRWRTGNIGRQPESRPESILESLPGDDGRDLDRQIDEARRRGVCARRMAAFRELSYRKTGTRRDWRLVRDNLLEGRSSHDLGRQEGITHARVQQIRNAALDWLRSGLLPKAITESRSTALQRRLAWA